MKIFIGPAGIGKGAAGLQAIKAAGLNAAEVEFTYSIYMNAKTAAEIGNFAKKLGINLSIHAPYWINLNSAEKKKVEQSKQRILKCCEIGHYLGASPIVFHPGFYGSMDMNETYKTIKNAIQGMQKVIKQRKWRVSLAPETTGKINVFGDLHEIGMLVKETGCSFCVDFAHLKARSIGRMNYEDILNKLNYNFKKEMLSNVHAHFSGVEWTSKGEKRHIITSENEIKLLADAIKKQQGIKSITIINESPNPLGDSIKMKDVFEK